MQSQGESRPRWGRGGVWPTAFPPLPHPPFPPPPRRWWKGKEGGWLGPWRGGQTDRQPHRAPQSRGRQPPGDLCGGGARGAVSQTDGQGRWVVEKTGGLQWRKKTNSLRARGWGGGDRLRGGGGGGRPRGRGNRQRAFGELADRWTPEGRRCRRGPRGRGQAEGARGGGLSGRRRPGERGVCGAVGCGGIMKNSRHRSRPSASIRGDGT